MNSSQYKTLNNSTVDSSGPHALETALVPVDDLEVVPEEFPPGMLAGVSQQGHGNHGLGCVSGRQWRLLADLAVPGARVDGVDHHVLHPLALQLGLQDPSVDLHRHLGDGVGALTFFLAGLARSWYCNTRLSSWVSVWAGDEREVAE